MTCSLYKIYLLNDMSSKVKKKQVLICGATGFIGRNIAELLAESDEYDVTGTCF